MIRLVWSQVSLNRLQEMLSFINFSVFPLRDGSQYLEITLVFVMMCVVPLRLFVWPDGFSYPYLNRLLRAKIKRGRVSWSKPSDISLHLSKNEIRWLSADTRFDSWRRGEIGKFLEQPCSRDVRELSRQFCKKSSHPLLLRLLFLIMSLRFLKSQSWAIGPNLKAVNLVSST